MYSRHFVEGAVMEYSQNVGEVVEFVFLKLQGCINF